MHMNDGEQPQLSENKPAQEAATHLSLEDRLTES